MIKRYRPAPGGASGTPCYFDVDTDLSGGSSYAQGTINIVGAAGAIVHVKIVPPFTNTNSFGQFRINGDPAFLGDDFYVTLDGSGNGTLIYRIEGDSGDTGSVVRAFLQIMGVTIGQIGSPFLKQESKIFS